METLRTALACMIFLSLAACAGAPEPAERQAKADGIASTAGFTGETIRTKRFDLHTRRRGTASGGLLIVYIEGDGFAWERRDRRSTDPTPINPVAMKMAAADPAPAIAYLARPCQFTGGETARNCTSDLWTTARYSEEAVAGMSEALDALKRKADASELALVGYSGGGTIAALLAARRTDIVWIKTVASPLDTDAFTSVHQVTSLSASLNPADKAATLAALPQIHYAGEKDDIVPVAINRRYLARMGDTRCAELVVIPGMDHVHWADVWASLTGEIPACR
ncbi:alpha/beta hydrolase family protein [Parvibaculum sp.]|uniref:alpha/beta hydrolase family protein n=1 Tax=Parvibaculum sp. TaxID=2024848 RepID=UPI003BA92410